MKPRLPARPLELVQLGVLLPWARPTAGKVRSRTSAEGSTRPLSTRIALGPAGPAVGPDQPESSRMAAARACRSDAQQLCESLYTHGGAIGRPMTLTRGGPAGKSRPHVPAASFIHRVLAHPNPPEPAKLLLHLRAYPRLLTVASGTALATYAERVDDMATYKQVWRMMIEQRLAPLGSFRHLTRLKHRREWSRPRGSVAKGIEDGVSDEPDPYFSIVKKPVKRRYAVRPNTWAMKSLPPLEHLPPRPTALEYVRHTHHLLLERCAPRLETALDVLASQRGLETQCTVEPNADDSPSYQEGYNSMKMLDLYLAYLPSLRRKGDTDPVDPLEMIDVYLAKTGTRARINKQTLHLSVKALLDSAPIRDTHPGALKEDTNGPGDSRPPLDPISRDFAPNKAALVLKALIHRTLAIISHFQSEHGIHAGPETCRILASFALHRNLVDVAKKAWEGWYDAVNRLERQVVRDLEREREGAVGHVPAETELRIRFRRVGSIRRRWRESVRRRFEKKGWVKRIEVGERGLALEDRGDDMERTVVFVWVGEEPQPSPPSQSSEVAISASQATSQHDAAERPVEDVPGRPDPVETDLGNISGPRPRPRTVYGRPASMRQDAYALPLLSTAHPRSTDHASVPTQHRRRPYNPFFAASSREPSSPRSMGNRPPHRSGQGVENDLRDAAEAEEKILLQASG
ncbi:hypothetical protein IAU60_004486 [Kwoniella sp. DSM 27419]